MEQTSTVEELPLEHLISQSQKVEQRIHEYVMASTTTHRFALLTIAAAFAIVGSAEADLWLVAVVPPVMMVMFFQIVAKDRETLALGAIQRDLEERIHQRTGEYLTVWESAVAERRDRKMSPQASAQTAIAVVVVGAFWAFGAVGIAHAGSSLWLALPTVGYLALGIYLIARAWRRFFSRYDLVDRYQEFAAQMV